MATSGIFRKQKHRLVGVVLPVALLLALTGCDSRNPASIYEARQGRPTPTPPERVVKSRQFDAPAENEPAKPRPTIRPGTVVQNNPQMPSAPLKKLNLQQMLLTNQVAAQANEPVFFNRLPMLFDEITDDANRSEEVNPLILVLRFTAPQKIKTVRTFPSHATHHWVLYTGEEGQGLMIRDAPQDDWSRIDLPEPVETKYVRIEVLRIERDDYVHLNELEIYVVE